VNGRAGRETTTGSADAGFAETGETSIARLMDGNRESN
jgi:hypothetical protein